MMWWRENVFIYLWKNSYFKARKEDQGHLCTNHAIVAVNLIDEMEWTFSTLRRRTRRRFRDALTHGEATHHGTFVALSFLRWRLIEVWWHESFWRSLCWVHAFGPCVCKVHAFAGVVLSCIGPAWPPRDCWSEKLLGSKPAVFVAGQLAMFVLEAILGQLATLVLEAILGQLVILRCICLKKLNEK